MKHKIEELRAEQDRYGFMSRAETTTKRLDLNDLLKRAEQKKNQDKKQNMLIVSSVLMVVVLVFAFFAF
tara:strand:+ start:1508 stop:1714 length:207 start_codon:yes stop_codon:yes gene_type:complete